MKMKGLNGKPHEMDNVLKVSEKLVGKKSVFALINANAKVLV
jgi:hypothetical protein